MAERLGCSNDDFIRTTEERHHPRRRNSGTDGRQWRHLQGQLCRLVFGARRSLLWRGGDDAPRRRRALRAAGHAGRMGRGGELFLPPLRLSGQAAGLYEANPDFIGPGERRNEVSPSSSRACEGSVDLAHHLRLGHQGAGRPEACDVCLGRCADQLHHRDRLSRSRQNDFARATGRPTSTSSARTSSASTRSTGRPS
jgi:hypothetical protein